LRALLPALSLIVCLVASPDAAFADTQSPKAEPSRAAIPFKKDERGAALDLPNIVAALVAVGLIGWGVLYALRRSNLLPNDLLRKSRRVRVIEAVRLDSKATLYLVAADDRTLLLGRSGDALVVLSELQAAPSAQNDVARGSS
jgi:flagellar biogenesis protein FliO